MAFLKVMAGFGLIFSLVQAEASVLVSPIHEIWNFEPGKAKILFQNDGRMVEVSTESSHYSLAFLAYQLGRPVRVSFSDAKPFQLKKLDLVKSNDLVNDNKVGQALGEEVPPYEPTVVKTREELMRLFRSTTPASKFFARSQCFRRAHHWSYDLWMDSKIKSMKAFIFFTKKYIREYNYDWWFHVAPFVYYAPEGNVPGAGKMNEAVLDSMYFTEAPVPLDDWASAFMENQAKCAEIQKYADFEAVQEKDYCVVRKVPMYYYAPDNVEELDGQGKALQTFESWELEDMTRDMYRSRW